MLLNVDILIQEIISEVIFLTGFKKISPEQLSDNMFKLIAKDWTLIAAGDKASYNMMTANWAGVGYLWMKHVAFVFIRPTRYTYEFTEKLDTMSLNFFTEEYRDILNLCGKKSGKEINKMEECDLTPVELSDGGIAFDESRIIFNCKKISTANLKDFEILDSSFLKYYENDEFHKLYICEITDVFIKE